MVYDNAYKRSLRVRQQYCCGGRQGGGATRGILSSSVRMTGIGLVHPSYHWRPPIGAPTDAECIDSSPGVGRMRQREVVAPGGGSSPGHRDVMSPCPRPPTVSLGAGKNVVRFVNAPSPPRTVRKNFRPGH